MCVCVMGPGGGLCWILEGRLVMAHGGPEMDLAMGPGAFGGRRCRIGMGEAAGRLLEGLQWPGVGDWGWLNRLQWLRNGQGDVRA